MRGWVSFAAADSSSRWCLHDFFAETLNKLVVDHMPRFKNIEQLLIITNQTTYERYYEKLTLLFKQQELLWYICPNSLEAKSFKELLALMTYCDEVDLNEQSLIVAIGTEPVIQLGNFLLIFILKNIH